MSKVRDRLSKAREYAGGGGGGTGTCPEPPGKFCMFMFVLRLNVPVNNFSVMSGRSHRFLGY